MYKRQVHNKDASTGDFKQAAGAIAFVVLSYLLILALFTFIYSRITAARITVPLKKLCDEMCIRDSYKCVCYYYHCFYNMHSCLFSQFKKHSNHRGILLYLSLIHIFYPKYNTSYSAQT